MSEADYFNLVRYPTLPRDTSLPSSLAALALLIGHDPVPFSRARVLEVGCGDGGNLLSLAAMAPTARFVGFDLADEPIAAATAVARDAGLGNVTFRVGDILDPDVVEGEFDYIIAHGVYSWVPAPVRDALMGLIAKKLSPQGIAFVSYNVSPGAVGRQAVRVMLVDAVRGVGQERRAAVARSALRKFLPYWTAMGVEGEVLRSEAETMLQRSPQVLAHDELSEVWEPQTLSDTVAAAAAAGLSYLGDTNRASYAMSRPQDEFADLREDAGGSWPRFEQLVDFALQTRFRESLFVRRPTGWPELQLERMTELHAQADLTLVETTPTAHAYETPRGARIEVDDPGLILLIERLKAAYPLTVSLDAAPTNLAATLSTLYVMGELNLYTEPLRFAAKPGERPTASPLARALLRRGDDVVATLRHLPLRVEDPAARFLIGLLDGSRDRSQLAAAMADRDGTPPPDSAQSLDGGLAYLGRAGLLVD